MPLYQTGGYQVKPSGVNKVKQDDPTRLLHLFIFKDAAAQTLHGQSEAVRLFESIYSPELVGGEVIFTDYEMIAGKR